MFLMDVTEGVRGANCEKCGVFVGRVGDGRWSLQPRFCDSCALAAQAEAARLVEEGRARQHAFRVREWREGSGIPEHLRGFRFADLAGDDALREPRVLAERWAAGDVSSLVLGGPVGRGKTRLAIAAANEMLERQPVLFFSAPNIMARLGSGSFGSRVREEALGALIGQRALVLDDLDKARPTEYAAEVLFLAIDQRAEREAPPILITTNLPGVELGKRWPGLYGEALVSRMKLMDGIRVEGPDRRKRG